MPGRVSAYELQKERFDRGNLDAGMRTCKDGDDRLVDGLNLLLLEQVAREKRRDQEAYRDEDGPRRQRLALRDVISCKRSAPGTSLTRQGRV